MQEYLAARLDYIFFFYGLGFVLLAAIASLLNRERKSALPWLLLAWFGATHGLNEWLDLLAFSLGDSPVFRVLRLAVMAASFAFLYEFGRRSSRALGARVPPAWILPVLAALSLSGAFYGAAGLNAAARYALGFTGALLAARAFLLSSEGRCGYCRAMALLFAAYAFAAGLVVPASGLFPASWLNYETFTALLGFPVQLLRGALACSMAACAWLYYLEGSAGFRKAQLGRRLLIGLLAALAAGFLLTEHNGDRMHKAASRDSLNLSTILRNRLEDALSTAENSVRSMSGAPWIVGTFTSAAPDAVPLGTSVLDRYCSSYGFTVCYLIDLKGTVSASSNFKAPDSLVGKNYGFRPYFREAAAGRAGAQFALGVTTGKRGFYASVPVMSGARQVGVAAIKRELDFLNADLRLFKYFFLVSPEGVIFTSSRPEYVFRALWPVPPGLHAGLNASRQFGAIDFLPLLEKAPGDGDHLRLAGENLHVSRTPLKWPGWSLIGLTSMEQTNQARLGGIALTFILCLLLVDFFLRLMRSEEERETAETLLALKEEVKTLSGIVPICASCKKIRDDKGYWSRVETYVAAHTQAQFSHGICPDCEKKLYPEYSSREPGAPGK